MAADLHIHVLEGITEEDLAAFFSNTLGSKYFNYDFQSIERPSDKPYDKVAKTPSVWIGEVSWLKAALLDDPDKYVPDPVREVSSLIGEELPVLDEELKEKLLKALDLENTTSYSVSQVDIIKDFLTRHMGKKLFTVSW